MQRNFILTDVMKTGNGIQFQEFINQHSMEDQIFDTSNEFYLLHTYDLDIYDRKFAIIDRNASNHHVANNNFFKSELESRVKVLKELGFCFIEATPWESAENIQGSSKWHKPELPIEIEHHKWTGGSSWFWFHMQNKHRHSRFNFTHDHNGSYWYKKHDFLYLNKAPRTHRVKLYDKLIQNNILDNSIYTFLMKDPPVRLDKKYELPGVDPENYPRWGKDQEIYELPYIDTVCSIVSETNDNSNDIFMTEKIWKPIIAEHMFVVHGNHLYLKKLREMGFKTFDPIFDESYDTEKNPDKRIDKIVTLCKQLKSQCDTGTVVERGNKRWEDIYAETESIRKHNYDTFFDKAKLSLEINKTLRLFLEFADRS
jgi:hypothetical protein